MKRLSMWSRIGWMLWVVVLLLMVVGAIGFVVTADLTALGQWQVLFKVGASAGFVAALLLGVRTSYRAKGGKEDTSCAAIRSYCRGLRGPHNQSRAQK